MDCISCQAPRSSRAVAVVAVALFVLVSPATRAAAQTDKPAPPSPLRAVTPVADTKVQLPPDYVIGVKDVLSVVFWRDREMSGDFTVRPDGKISLPLLNEVQAAGLTPEQLRESLLKTANKYIEDASVAVIVKQINSLQVFITGEVEKPGAYPLVSSVTVIQLIAIAGGFKDFAHKDRILILRTQNGNQLVIPFDYVALSKGQNAGQNIELRPGDVVIVP